MRSTPSSTIMAYRRGRSIARGVNPSGSLSSVEIAFAGTVANTVRVTPTTTWESCCGEAGPLPPLALELTITDLGRSVRAPIVFPPFNERVLTRFNRGAASRSVGTDTGFTIYTGTGVIELGDGSQYTYDTIEGPVNSFDILPSPLPVGIVKIYANELYAFQCGGYSLTDVVIHADGCPLLEAFGIYVMSCATVSIPSLPNLIYMDIIDFESLGVCTDITVGAQSSLQFLNVLGWPNLTNLAIGATPVIQQFNIYNNPVLESLENVNIGVIATIDDLWLYGCNFDMPTIQAFMTAYFSNTMPLPTIDPYNINVLSQQSGILVPTEAEPWQTLLANGLTIANFPSPPDAPVDLVATPGDGQITIVFTAGADGGAPITDYQWIDTNGGSWTPLGDAASPVVITGLTNGVEYSIQLRAVNVAGTSVASDTITATPALTEPNPPSDLVATAGNGQATITFTAGSAGGYAPLTGYDYSLNNSTIWTSTGSASSPVTISGLTNGTSYSVVLRTVATGANSAASSSVSVTPSTFPVVSKTLLIRLESADTASYPGSGVAWKNIAPGYANTYDASLLNGPTYASSVFTFNGTNQSAQIANASVLEAKLGQYRTALVWVNMLGSGGGVFSKNYGSTGGYDGYRVGLAGTNGFVFGMNGNSHDDRPVSDNNIFTTGTWHMVSAVVCFGGGSGNPSNLYIDDQASAVLTINSGETGLNSTAPISLAATFIDSGSPSGFLNCKIGAFYYYAGALMQSEIATIYNATKATYGL